MKRIGQRWAIGFVVCVQAMMCACGSRAGAGGAPTTLPVDQPPPAPAAPQPGPEQPVSPSVPAPRPEPLADDCAVVPSTGDPIASVGLSERVNPSNAPRPTNDSERLLFRQLYETLVRVDCMDRTVPALAESWRLDADGRTWIVTLRDGARFSDGTPVASNDVRASWMREGAGDALRTDVSRLVESIAAIDDRTLAIRLHTARVDMPAALAHADLAISKSAADSAWPLGTRSSRIVEGDASGSTSVITLSRENRPTLRFDIASSDPRDALDRGVDLLLTRNPAALDYASTLPSFQTVPQAWQRTHVLLSPGRARSSPTLTDGQRQVLADDAVRGDARGAQGPFWWQTLTNCEVPMSPPRTQSAPTPRIVYDADDRVARELAERFVGLARASSPGATGFLDVLLPDRPRRTYQRATGLTGEPLALARRLGTDAGYVMALDSHPLDPCRDFKALNEVSRWVDAATIVPLVETRLHAVVRRGRGGLTADADGAVLISAPGGDTAGAR